jgi:hypothetical protein
MPTGSRHSAALTVLILALLLTSCNDEPSGPSGGGIFFPLSMGNSWSYRYTMYDSTGGVRDTVTVTEFVDGEFTVNGTRWCSIMDPMAWFFGIRPFYANLQGGLYVSLDSAKTSERKYKYPAAMNEAVVQNGDTVWIAGTAITVLVPAGTFTCVQYQKRFIREGLYFTENTYIAPGIGIVKTESSLSRDQRRYIKGFDSQLTAYRVE